MLDTNIYDIAIIGAGPAGCAAALGLGKSGLKVALIDKDRFPREKACGDAIPGPAISTLEKAFPFFQDEFFNLKKKHRIRSSSIILNNGRPIDYYWKLPAYNIKRSL
ncbi:MAG: NAD(P)/FAD-dependent oxidoreductase, partial [Bacteroidetes bacterium]